MDVKALPFDVFGTVVDWRGGIAREIAALGAARGFSLDWNAFALAWRARYQPAMERVRSGARGFVKLDLARTARTWTRCWPSSASTISRRPRAPR